MGPEPETETPRASLLQSRRFWGALVGSGAFIALILLPPLAGLTRVSQNAGAVAALMACFWIGEVIPIYATALLPIALFPLLGVLEPKKVTPPYADEVVFLMMGGFMMAQAMQKWGLHRRIALHTIRLIGGSPSRIILGFMIATAVLSMWMSNSATAVMMLPIALSVIWRTRQSDNDEAVGDDPFSAALCLGIAYSASIGGVATLVGTPPNAIFAGQMKKLFPQAPEIFFYQWMKLGVPISVLMLAATWVLLTRVLFPVHRQKLALGPDIIRDELKELGPISPGERAVLIVSLLTAGLWITRGLWANLLPETIKLSDATIAIAAAATLFLFPVNWKQGEFALDWEAASRIPWGVLVLFGGGFALAAGLQDSGFAVWAGEHLKTLHGLHPLVHVALVCLLMTFMTEVTPNTAMATIMMPIMAFTAVALKIHPYLLMVPATLSASCAFMLPSGTPPNAIVFGAGHVRLPQMAKAGLALNLIGVAVIALMVYFLGGWALGQDLAALPGWAISAGP